MGACSASPGGVARNISDAQLDETWTAFTAPSSTLGNEEIAAFELDYELLRRSIRCLDDFSEYSDRLLDRLIRGALIRSFAPGRIVYAEGDVDNDGFYFVGDGSVISSSSSTTPNRAGRMSISVRGNIFGENEAIKASPSPRSETVKCVPTAVTTLIKIPRSAIMNAVHARREILESNSFQLLADSPLLTGLGERDLMSLHDAFRPRRCLENEVLLGLTTTMPDLLAQEECLYIVEAGDIKVQSLGMSLFGGQTLFLGPGSYFGEETFLEEQTFVPDGSSVSVTAMSDCILLVLTKEAFAAQPAFTRGVLLKNIAERNKTLQEEGHLDDLGKWRARSIGSANVSNKTSSGAGSPNVSASSPRSPHGHGRPRKDALRGNWREIDEKYRRRREKEEATKAKSCGIVDSNLYYGLMLPLVACGLAAEEEGKKLIKL